MKPVFFLLLAFTTISVGYSQTRTITTTGNWNNTGIWQGGLIADLITEDAVMNNNLGTITVPTSYTIGNITMNNGNTLTINSGVTLNLGQSGTPKNLTSGNTGTINITGTLIIWGNLNTGNSLDLNVLAGGVLIIKGNVAMGNGGDLVINGNVQVDGNFVGGNNTNLIVNGTMNIGGNLQVGNNSNPSGTGTVTVGGSCADGNSNFCATGPLPIKLISFSATRSENSISIKWVTSMEKNFDYFQLERAGPDLSFIKLIQLKGKGGMDVTTAYTYLDLMPNRGKNYYRLKSVDLDGTFEYSNVIVAEWNGDNQDVYVYPNPVANHSFTLELNDPITLPAILSLYEARGFILFQGHVNSTSSTISLPGNIGAGVYIMKLSFASGQRIVRVVLE